MATLEDSLLNCEQTSPTPAFAAERDPMHKPCTP